MTPSRTHGNHRSPSAGPIMLRPKQGTTRFRKHVSLRLEDEAIDATDRRGRTRRFPLDETDRAPAEVRIFGLMEQGLVDGAGNLLALWENGIWDTKKEVEFCTRAGLGVVGFDNSELPQMRSDGIKMFDIPALSMMQLCSAIGAVGFAGIELHIGPEPLADAVLTLGFAGSVTSFVLWRRASRPNRNAAARRKRTSQGALAEADAADEDV
jgi:hypothetical protein